MRKHILLILVILGVLACIAFSGAAIAYFTDSGSITNALEAAKNEVSVAETFSPPDELKVGDNKFVKEVQIKNEGNIPCYIRVFVGFSDSNAKDNVYMSSNSLSDDNRND